MAGLVKSFAFKSQKRTSAVLLAVLVSVVEVAAQDLPDPTKPPRFGSNVQQAEGDSGVPVLTAILIGPKRKFAIIDGQTVKLNAKFGDQTLVQLTETEAVLKLGRTQQILKLVPDIKNYTQRAIKRPILENAAQTTRQINAVENLNKAAKEKPMPCQDEPHPCGRKEKEKHE